MDTPDLRAPRLRILECTACHEPVWAEPNGTTLRLTCGYCGHEDAREISPHTLSGSRDDAYRGPREPGRSRRVETDLSQPPPGISRRPTLVQLRAELDRIERELGPLAADSEERLALEFRQLYCAAVTAAVHLQKRDALRARAALESALETVRHPVHRALVLARLARLAALGEGIELAERWLEAIPKELRVPEIGCDVRIARAMIARARGNAQEMLDALGSEDTWTPAARPLGMALVVDAIERSGDVRAARKAYRRGSKGAALAFGSAIRTYGLAPKTLQRTERVGFFAIGLIAVLLLAIGLSLHGNPLAALPLLAVGIVGVIVLKQF